MAFALKLPFTGRRNEAAEEQQAAADTGEKRSGGIGTARKLQFLIGALIVLLAVDGVIVALDARQGTFGTLYIASVGKIRMLSQRLAKAAQQASQGNIEAFKQLKESRDEFAALMKLLSDGGQTAGTSLPPTSAAAKPALDALDKEWKKTEKNSSGPNCKAKRAISGARKVMTMTATKAPTKDDVNAAVSASSARPCRAIG